jgi:hypothetical protein
MRALSGGAARRGETCGALLGALMALGLYEGRKRFEELPKLNSSCDNGLTLSNEFMRRIETEYGLKKPLGSTLYRDPTQTIYGRSWNLTDPIERADFSSNGGSHSDRSCPKVCEIAAEAAAEIILKKGLS